MQLKQLYLLFPFLIFAVLFVACENEEEPQELNIKYVEIKSLSGDKGVNSQQPEVSYAVYPNPFETAVNFRFFNYSAEHQVELFITDSKGDYKKLNITEEAFMLDFSEEENGSYYCEIRINYRVYQEHLLKIDTP